MRVGNQLAEDALWSYPEPLTGCPDIGGLAAFYWNRMDAWFEEDEQMLVHARDPYTRIDVLENSRRVEVSLCGVSVAESRRPVLLFETGLPVRYYLPKLDVRMKLLRPTDTVTACPYKGETSQCWTVAAGGETAEDAAWCYEQPTPGSSALPAASASSTRRWTSSSTANRSRTCGPSGPDHVTSACRRGRQCLPAAVSSGHARRGYVRWIGQDRTE